MMEDFDQQTLYTRAQWERKRNFTNWIAYAVIWGMVVLMYLAVK